MSIESPLPQDRPRFSYDPTVLPNKTAASNIFKKMKKGWQDESQCYNRAHIWTYEEFQRSGTNTMKLFMFFTNRYIRNYRFKWWFHVSPMAMVKEGSTVNRRVLDRRYTSGPLFTKTWTDIFIKSKKTCPVVSKYSEYRQNQEKQDCYLIPVSQFFWQPRDIDAYERSGYEKTSYQEDEVEHAYWEAF